MRKEKIQRGFKGDHRCDHPKGDQEAGRGQASTGRGAAKHNHKVGVSIGQSRLRVTPVERKAARLLQGNKQPGETGKQNPKVKV